MTLQQALHIGTTVDGYVKCTYAMLYDAATGNKLFSVNRTNISKARIDYEKQLGDVDVYEADNKVYMHDIPILSVNAEDIPDVNAKFIKATLDESARRYINDKIMGGYIARHPSGNFHTNAYANDGAHYVFQFEKGSQVLVKNVAIDWVPANMDNMDIVDENGQPFEAQLRASEEKLRKAKALLIAAAGTVII